MNHKEMIENAARQMFDIPLGMPVGPQQLTMARVAVFRGQNNLKSPVAAQISPDGKRSTFIYGLVDR